MDVEPWVHFLHVAAASVWVGGGIIMAVVGVHTRRSTDPARLADFAQLLPFAGLRVLTALLPALRLPDAAPAQSSAAASMRSKEIAA